MAYTSAVISIRVSTKEQGDSRLGLEAQESACRTFCEANGLPVLGMWHDVASGAVLPQDRPGLTQARGEVMRRPGCVLVVAKLDRLSRDEAVLHTMAGDVRVPFCTAEDGLDMAPMMLSLKAMIAAQERRLISARTQAALASLKARGVALGGAQWVDREATQAKAVARSVATRKGSADAWAAKTAPQLRTLLRAGLTYAGVAEHLNAFGTPTRDGGAWHASTVSRCLKRADSV